LASRIQEWLGGGRGVSVLDFSGVASEATDVAVGVVLSLLFEVAVSSPPDSGIGRARPLLIILEEAHRYLGTKPAASGALAADAANRIAREGRKYGVGLMAVTQRPTELSDVILSQVGTHIALRLTNSSDQSTVKTSLPDAIANIAEALPSLRNGEALVTGEAIPLPTRVLIDRPSPAPRADDPSLESWKGEAKRNDVAEALKAWRLRSKTG
jgi:DNA helicase HerA-like ATPase